MQPRIITELKDAIRAEHGCEALYIQTVDVKTEAEAASRWDRLVKVFELIGHPTAKRCYAWRDNGDRTFTMLQLPPITSPESAVKLAYSQE